MHSLFRSFLLEVNILYLEKIINNNVAQVRDDDGNQFVVMGSGLAFQAKVGQIIPPSKIEKTFVLQDSNQDFNAILQTLNQDEIEVVSNVIQMGENLLETEFPTSLLFTLGDHIHFAIERNRENLIVKNPLTWQIRRLYPEEYQAGLKAVDYINDHFNTQLDESEATSVAIHFITALRENNLVEETMRSVQLIESIISIVELHYGRPFDQTSNAFHRFTTHLEYFAERILNRRLQNDESDDFLFEQVRSNYPVAFKASEKIQAFITSSYQYTISTEEMIYLTIHINRSMREAQ